MDSKFPYLDLAYTLAVTVRRWKQEDFELDSARAELPPQERLNEEAESERIRQSRNNAVRQLIEKIPPPRNETAPTSSPKPLPPT